MSRGRGGARALLVLGLVLAFPRPGAAAERRFLSEAELLVLGVSLRAEPASQVVPAGVPTVLRTALVAAGHPELVVPVGDLPPDLKVRAVLSGPGLAAPRPLECAPGQELYLPGLQREGTYRVQNIRLQGAAGVLLVGEPASVEVQVKNILVTSISSRPLSLAELEERGIVLDPQAFETLNFTVSLALESGVVTIEVPTLIPSDGPPILLRDLMLPLDIGPILDAPPVVYDTFDSFEPFLPRIELPVEDPRLRYSVTGMLVFPQAVGFLRQFSSVLLVVTNAAPSGSPLSVKDLKAAFRLPAGLGRSSTVPLTLAGEPVPVRNQGPDGKLGTADDLNILVAAMSGASELVTVGLEEGLHRVDVELAGTVTGLPAGEAPLTGSASGVVLVRNPRFSLTFLVPGAVEEGREFELGVVLTNTSAVPANLASVRISRSAVAGATLLGDELAVLETIPPGESATARYRMRALRTGRVAATRFLDPGHNVQGRFDIQVAVGDDGIPVSPEVVTLPEVAYRLPGDLVDALLAFLGSAWSNATAGPDQLPPGMPQVTTGAVKRAAAQVADAGQRIELGEAPLGVLSQLLLRLSGAEQGSPPLDALRRRSSRWPRAAQAFARAYLAEAERAGQGAGDLAAAIARTHYYDAPLLLAGVDASVAGSLRLEVEDGAHRRLGGESGARDLPSGEILHLDGRRTLAQVATPSGAHRVRLEALRGGSFSLTLVAPREVAPGRFELRRVDFGHLALAQGQIVSVGVDPASDRYRLEGLEPVRMGTATPIEAPPLGVVSTWVATSMDPGHHVMAVLYNRPVDAETARAAGSYRFSGPAMAGQAVVAASLQSSGRYAFLRLRNPVPPEPESRIEITGVKDRDGNVMARVTKPIAVEPLAGWGTVAGTALDGKGRPVADLPVKLEETLSTTFGGDYVLQTTATARTDSRGQFKLWFSRRTGRVARLTAYDPRIGEGAEAYGTLRSDREELLLDLHFLGRGDVTGRVVSAQGEPVPGALVTGQGTLQQAFAQAWTQADGRFRLERIAVGTATISAKTRDGRVAARTLVVPGAGATVDVGDLVLAANVARGEVRGAVMVDGVPVAGAPVTLESEGTSPPWGTWTITDADGAFRFSDVPAGWISAGARDPRSWQTTTASARGLLAGGSSLRLDLYYSRGTGRVSGRVLDGSNRPAVGARVLLQGLGEQLTTNGGRFAFDQVPLGGGSLVATWSPEPGQAPRTGVAGYRIAYTGQEQSLTIQLPASGRARFLVTDEDGQAVRGALVRLGDSGYSCSTSSGGGCDIENVPVGAYTASVLVVGSGTPPELRAASGSLVLRVDGDERTLHLQLPRRVLLAGRTFDHEGAILGGAKVYLRAPGVDPEGYPDLVDLRPVDSHPATGRFEFAKVPEGPYMLRATHFSEPGGEATATGELRGDTVRDLRFPEVGRSMGLTVHVLLPDGSAAPAEGLLTTVWSGLPRQDGEGQDHRFLIPPGAFSVKVVRSDGSSVWKAVAGGSAQAETRFDIRLLGRGSVRCEVLDGQGSPVPGARLRLRAAGVPGEPQEREETADSSGRFTFSNVTEGVVSVVATGGSASGQASGSVVHGGTLDLRIRFAPVRAAEGRVVREDGVTPAAGVAVVVKQWSTGGGSQGWLVIDGTVTDPAGRFTLGPLPYQPGGTPYRLAAHDLTRGRYAVRDMVLGEASPSFDLRLGGLGAVEGFVLDSDGLTPLRATRVELQAGSGNPEMPGLSLFATVDPSSGFYRFDGVAEGSFRARAPKPTTRLWAEGLGRIARQGHEARLDLLVEPHGLVGGEVRNADGSIRVPATVRLYHARLAPTDRVEVPVDGGGRFVFTDVPLGEFRIEATTPPGPRSDTASFAGRIERDAELVSVELRLAGFVPVTVRVLENGALAPRAYDITLVHAVTEHATGAEHLFPQVRRGLVTVQVWDPGSGNRGSASVLIPPEATGYAVDVPVGPVAALSGTVVDGDDVTPVGNALVEALVEGAGDPQLYVTRSAPDGSFAFDAIRAQGRLRLDARPAVGGGRARVRHRFAQVPGPLAYRMRLDRRAPELVSSSPAADATGVSPGLDHLELRFSEPMDEPSLKASNLALDGVAVAPSRVSVTGSLVNIALAPGALASSRSYTLLVRGAAEDANGVALGRDQAVRFTTLDDLRPTVLLESPAPGAENVPLATTVLLRFSEPMDAASVPGAATLACGAMPAGQAAPDPDLVHARFGGPLPPDRECLVAVSSGARDLAGNPAVPASFRFRTRDTIAPVLDGLVLAPELAEYPEHSLVEATPAIAAGTLDVMRVDYLVDGVRVASATEAPFATSLEVPGMTGTGEFEMAAVATDPAGNGSRPVSRVLRIGSDMPPALRIVSPREGQEFDLKDTVPVKLRASDAGGLVELRYVVTGIASSQHTRSFDPPSRDEELLEHGFEAPATYEPGSIEIVATATDTFANTTIASLSVRLLETSIEGIVRRPDLSPAPGVLVSATRAGAAERLEKRSDGSGHYKLGLKPGAWDLVYHEENTGRRARLSGLVVAAGDQRDLGVTRLGGAGTVSGLVSLEGRAFPGAPVEVRSAYGVHRGVSGPGGAYSVAKVPEGPLAVVARGPATLFESDPASRLAAGDGFSLGNIPLALPGPAIDLLSPGSGAAGQPVTLAISGHHFHDAVAVYFDGAPLSLGARDFSNIAVTLPARPHGGYTLEVRNPGAEGTATRTFPFSAGDLGKLCVRANVECRSAFDMVPRGADLFVATERGLRAYRRAPAGWSVRGEYPEPGGFRALAVTGRWLFAASAGQVSLFDVEPAAPVLLGATAADPRRTVNDLVVAAPGEVWAALGNRMVRLGVKDGALELRGTLHLGLEVSRARLAGHRLYVASSGAVPAGGLRVFDVSDPERPRLLGERRGAYYRLAVAGDRVVAARDGNPRTLEVLEASRPNDMQVLASVQTGHVVDELHLSGGRAYFTTGAASRQVQVLDVQQGSLLAAERVDAVEGQPRLALVDGTSLLVAGLLGGDVRELAILERPRDARPLAVTRRASATAGGLRFAISGHDFREGATVRVDGVPAVVELVGKDQIVAVAPPHAAGAGLAVSVANPGGDPGVLAGAFEYTDGPRLLGIAPGHASSRGGMPLRVDGIQLEGRTIDVGGNLFPVTNGTVPARPGEPGQLHDVSHQATLLAGALLSTSYLVDLERTGPLSGAQGTSAFEVRADGRVNVASVDGDRVEIFRVARDGTTESHRSYRTDWCCFGPQSLVFRDDLLYLSGEATGVNGVRILDPFGSPEGPAVVADVSHPSFIGNPPGAGRIRLNAGRLYTQDEGCAYEVSSPASPVLLGCLGADLGGFEAEGSYLYDLAWDGTRSRLRVYDFTRPARAALLAERSLPVHGSLTVTGDRAFVATLLGPWSIDLGDPAAPVLEGPFPLPAGRWASTDQHGIPYPGFVTGDTLWVALHEASEGGGGWQSYEVSDVRHPVAGEARFRRAGADAASAVGGVAMGSRALVRWGVGTHWLVETDAAAAAPRLDAIDPPSGPPEGGARVVLRGRYFEPGALVRFGSVEVNARFVSGDRLVAVAPAGSGVGGVTVRNPDGRESASRGFTWEAGPPRVVSVEPGAGPLAGGTSLTVHGWGLATATEVRFRQVRHGVEHEAAGAILSVGPTSISVASPPAPAGEAGPADVKVLAAGGQHTFEGGFDYLPAQVGSHVRQGGWLTACDGWLFHSYFSAPLWYMESFDLASGAGGFPVHADWHSDGDWIDGNWVEGGPAFACGTQLAFTNRFFFDRDGNRKGHTAQDLYHASAHRDRLRARTGPGGELRLYDTPGASGALAPLATLSPDPPGCFYQFRRVLGGERGLVLDGCAHPQDPQQVWSQLAQASDGGIQPRAWLGNRAPAAIADQAAFVWEPLGLRVYDVSDPLNPVAKGLYPVRRGEVVLTHDRLYSGRGRLVEVWDRAGTFTLAPRQRIPTPVNVTRILVWGRYLVLDQGPTFLDLASADPPLRPASVYPAAGPAAGGQELIVRGDGFDASTTVKLGANAATGLRLLAPTALSVLTPAGQGTVDVEVTRTPPGQAPETVLLPSAYTYQN